MRLPKLEYPCVTGRTADEKIEQLQRHLYTMTEKLNLVDDSAQGILTEITQALSATEPDVEQAVTNQSLQHYKALKDLVIKTADFAVQNSEQFKLALKGDYVAISDFGKYWQEATMEIEGTEFGIRQLFEYAEGVNNAYTVNSKQYVKTGLLYYDDDTGLPVYGVGVGNIETTVTDENETVIDKTANELVTVTPGKISFWQQGTEVAYLSQQKLHFPAGTLEAYEAKLSGTLTAGAGSKIGPWNITASSIYYGSSAWGNSGGMYFGTSGLSVKDKFKVDANGNLTATGANITGKITATSLDVTNATVTGLSASAITTGTLSADRISGGTLDCNYVSLVNLDAGSINTGVLKGVNVESYRYSSYYGSTVKMMGGSLSIGYTSSGGSYSEAGYIWYDSSDRVYFGANDIMKLEAGGNLSIDAGRYRDIYIAQSNNGQGVHIGSSGVPATLYLNGYIVTCNSDGTVTCTPE